MRVLVTGAAGFVGSHLVDRLLADDHQVTALDDLSSGRLANLAEARRHKGLRFHRFDVTSEDLAELVARDRPDVVLHLAAAAPAAEPLQLARTSGPGTANLLEACVRAGVPRLVHASGSSVYGDAGPRPVGERAGLRPASARGAAQVTGETWVQTYGRLGLATATLRLGTVYGARQQPPAVVASLLRALLDRRPGRLRGDGTAVRDYVHVEDVVDAVVRCLGGRADGRRLNVGSGRGTSLRELHRLIADAVGAPDAPDFVPPLTGDPRAVVLDSGAARRALGWEAVVGLEDGLARTVDALRLQGPPKR